MKLYKDLLTDFENMGLGHSAIGIIASSCLGSIAAMLILINGNNFLQMLQLFIVVCVCMGFNAVVLAQFRAKIILNALIISLVTSAFLIIINII